MELSRRNANLLLLLAAAIWGFAFVAQRVGMRHVEPLTFNGIRFALGAAVLLPLLRARGLRPGQGLTGTAGAGGALRAGLVTGLVLFCGANLQQFGVVYTTAGKAGFITSLYVVFVPLLGLVVGHRTGRAVWWGVALAAAGLYLLSARGLVGIDPGDGLVLLGAIFWAVHVLAVGHFVRKVPAVTLAVGQFTTMAVLSLIAASVLERPTVAGVRAAAVPILYAGLMSVAVAYTLQVFAQRRARPAHAAVILSFEAVFAAVGGALVLSESLGPRELAGCVLMLGGVLLAQREESA